MNGVLQGKVVVGVVAGLQTSAAIDSEGSVYSWGDGFFGVLGYGGYKGSSVPVLVKNSGAMKGKKVG